MKALRAFWGWLRAVSGDDAYERRRTRIAHRSTGGRFSASARLPPGPR